MLNKRPQFLNCFAAIALFVAQTLSGIAHADGDDLHIHDHGPDFGYSFGYDFGHNHHHDHGHEQSECAACLAAPAASDPYAPSPTALPSMLLVAAERTVIVPTPLTAVAREAARVRGPPVL